MWYRGKIAKCYMCGKTAPIVNYDYVDELPFGWFGSLKKKGLCFCSDCRKKEVSQLLVKREEEKKG